MNIRSGCVSGWPPEIGSVCLAQVWWRSAAGNPYRQSLLRFLTPGLNHKNENQFKSATLYLEKPSDMSINTLWPAGFWGLPSLWSWLSWVSVSGCHSNCQVHTGTPSLELWGSWSNSETNCSWGLICFTVVLVWSELNSV